MKQMTTNEVVYDYQAPSVEILKVAVEKGFAGSITEITPGSGTSDSTEDFGTANWGN